MARPLRIEFANALYHVTCRGNERRSIFRSDRDRRTFLMFLGRAAKRFGWSISAWVLMTNHFHIVIQTPQPNLSRGMQWLNGTYAGWFNHVHNRSGHLFQGRFHAFLIEKEAYFTQVLRYVVLNPVRAKIVERPENYRWSSHRIMAGLDQPSEWLDLAAALAPFGGRTTDGFASYRSFVEEKLELQQPLWNRVTNAIYLGTESWARRLRTQVESAPRSTEHPCSQRAVGRPKMAAVVQAVARAAQSSSEVVRSRGGAEIRRLAAWLGWHEGLLTLRSIAAGLRLRSEGHISNLIRRCDLELGTSPELRANLDASLSILRS